MKQPSKQTDRRTLTRQEEFVLAKFMEPLIERSGDKSIKYIADWSDEQVMKECGVANINEMHIARLRLQVFGKLTGGFSGSLAPMAQAFERIKQLEGRVAALEDAATNPQLGNGRLQPRA